MKKVKSKTIAIFGIITWILSVISSAEDLAGNYTAPIVLIIASAIASLIFIIMAAIRLWRPHKVAITLFLVFSVSSLIYVSAPVKIINFIIFIWVISLLWVMGKHEAQAKILQRDSGLTDDEFALVQESMNKGNPETATQIISAAQERHIHELEKATGINVRDLTIEIGMEISWEDIVNHVFRVLDFDRNATIINDNNQVIAKSMNRPYGYLLTESPILNNRTRLPIIHRDDFLLAASVFDEPELVDLVESDELLVTYAPEILGPNGLSGSPYHVLHYAIVPSGTLDAYYSFNNDEHFAKPQPQKILGPFIYRGEIKVQINTDPKI